MVIANPVPRVNKVSATPIRELDPNHYAELVALGHTNPGYEEPIRFNDDDYPPMKPAAIPNPADSFLVTRGELATEVARLTSAIIEAELRLDRLEARA